MASKPHVKFHGNTLQRREVAGFSVREIFHPSGDFIPRHSHEHAHVGFILHGGFTESFDRRALECRPLSVSYISPGLAHTDDFRKGVHCLVFEISPERLGRVQQLLTLPEPIFVCGGPAAWLAMRLYREAGRSDEASSLAMEGLALEILAELSREQASPAHAKPPRWLQEAQEFLHARFEKTVTHDELGRLVDIHPVHLATVFRKHFGCTVGEYLRRLRIEFASRQLENSDDPLGAIAFAAGFSDQSHFSKVFKRQTGMTPGQFRSQLRKP